jgi:hypothetical protein
MQIGALVDGAFAAPQIREDHAGEATCRPAGDSMTHRAPLSTGLLRTPPGRSCEFRIPQ